MTVHERDCEPCDAARQVVEALRNEYDPLSNWDDTEVEGVTQTALTVQLVADVLHRFPLGRPPLRPVQSRWPG